MTPLDNMMMTYMILLHKYWFEREYELHVGLQVSD